jgi:hypothetical protein
MSFYDGTTTLTTSGTLASGSSSYAVSVPSVGSHTYAASYAGDTNFSAVAKTSATSALAVSKAVVTIAGPTTQPVNVVNGQTGSVAVMATGQYSGPGISMPTGTLTYTIVNASSVTVTSGSATLTSGNSSATATITVPSTLATGGYTVNVSYSGDTNYSATTTSTAIALQVGQIRPTITWPAASAITYGQTLASSTLTGGTGSVPGSFAFTTPATTPGVGAATQSVTFTPADSTDYSSVTGTVSVTVNKATPTASVTSNSNPALVQNAATFTATVSSQAGTPTGTVTFLDGTTPLGTGTLSGGLAMLTTSALTAGTHSICVIYGGDTNFAAANSGALTQSVLDFSLIGGSGNGGSGTTQTVFPGGIATYALAFQPSAGVLLPLPATLTVSGMPAGAVATITPSSWTQLTSTSWSFPANTALANISLSIQLPSTMSSLNQKDQSSRKLPLIFLSIFLLPFAGRMRRASKKLSRMLSMLLLLIAGMTALAGLSGCGSATGFFAQARQSYTVTATVTSGTLSHSTTMTLTVE